MESKLTAEQIEKIKECKNMEELKKLVQTENIELTDKELEGIVGGTEIIQASNTNFPSIRTVCKKCGKKVTLYDAKGGYKANCPQCGNLVTLSQSDDPTYQKLLK